MLTKEKCVELGIAGWVKKPIPAYAVQLVPDNDKVLAYDPRVDLTSQTIRTLEGVFHFDLGDYLVIGNDDEIWSVKKSIFEATYELYNQEKIQNKIEWIKFKVRDCSEEEKEWYGAEQIWDCQIPEDEEEVLVTDGYSVWIDTWLVTDNGSFLENSDDGETLGYYWSSIPTPQIEL